MKRSGERSSSSGADVAEDRGDVSSDQTLRMARALHREGPTASNIGVGRDRVLQLVLGAKTRHELPVGGLGASAASSIG